MVCGYSKLVSLDSGHSKKEKELYVTNELRKRPKTAPVQSLTLCILSPSVKRDFEQINTICSLNQVRGIPCVLDHVIFETMYRV